MPNRSVCPSGGACTTAFAAILPLPPGRFSTTILCPISGPAALARMRAMVSTVPPAAKPTMTCSVRSGKAARATCGATTSALAAPAATRPIPRRVIAAAMSRRSREFDHVNPTLAIGHIDEATLVHGHVIRGRPLAVRRRIGLVKTDLARTERIGKIDDAQPLREPREWNDRSGEHLGGLVAAGHRRLRRTIAIETGHVERGDRHRLALVRYVVDPGKRRWRGTELRHILIGHDHDAAALQRFGDRQASVRRMRMGRAAVHRRHQPRL